MSANVKHPEPEHFIYIQRLSNAVIGQVKFGQNHMSGNATYQAARTESLNVRALSGAGTVERSRASASVGS
jgi:hypothetical protein